jgi:hypothetical protein
MTIFGIDARLPLAAAALTACFPIAQASAACTPTGFFRDSINMTAALINPPGTVKGDVDATGCNIGIYYGPGAHGRVNLANVHGANYFGIVNNSADVDITNSSISDIGEKPFNGTQHGVGIYFVFGSNARGKIEGNSVWSYQKGGIVVNAGTSQVNIERNTVTGLGPVAFIAQNGIQVGYGAKAKAQQNYVSGNSYTGSGETASAGVLVVGGDCNFGPLITGVEVQDNTATGNDVGIWLTNLDASCNPPATPTRNTAKHNTLINNALNNTSGNITQGYQAGIVDSGNKDVIQQNEICGLGYQPPGTPATAAFAIDVTFTINPTVKNNTFCQENYSPPSTASAMARRAAILEAATRSAAAYK